MQAQAGRRGPAALSAAARRAALPAGVPLLRWAGRSQRDHLGLRGQRRTAHLGRGLRQRQPAVAGRPAAVCAARCSLENDLNVTKTPQLQPRRKYLPHSEPQGVASKLNRAPWHCLDACAYIFSQARPRCCCTTTVYTGSLSRWQACLQNLIKGESPLLCVRNSTIHTNTYFASQVSSAHPGQERGTDRWGSFAWTTRARRRRQCSTRAMAPCRCAGRRIRARCLCLAQGP